MAEPDSSSKPAGFWYLIGAAVALLAAALAWRIAAGSGGVTVDADKDGKFTIRIDEARQELEQAKTDLAKLQGDLQARDDALHEAEQALADKEKRIDELLTKLEKENEALGSRGGASAEHAGAIAADLEKLKAERPTRLLMRVPTPNPQTFATIRSRLDKVQGISRELGGVQ